MRILRLRFTFLIAVGFYLLAANTTLACVPAAVPFQWQTNSSDFIGIVEVTGIQERGKEQPPLLKVKICKQYKSKVDSTSAKKEAVIALLVDFTDDGDGAVHMCNAMWIPSDKRYEMGSLYLAFLKRTKQKVGDSPVMTLTVSPVPVSFLESFRAITNNVFSDFAPLPKARQFVWTQEYLSAIERLVAIETLSESNKAIALQQLALSYPKNNSVPLTYSSGKAMTLSDVAQDWLKDLNVSSARNE